MSPRSSAAAGAVGLALCLVTAPSFSQGAPAPTAPAPSSTAPAQPPPPDPWGGMNAGGLTPPPPMNGQPPPQPGAEQKPPPTSLTSDLDESKEKDSGRGVSWFWIEAQGGYEHLGLQTFEIDGADLSAGFTETTANGGVVSAGLGAQIIFLTLGVRGRLGFFPDWQAARIGGEVGFKIPVGFVEPRFDIGAGYAALTNLDGAVPESIGINGFYVRAGAGVDFYPVELLALGLVASFDFMGLSRAGLSPAEVESLRTSRPDVTDAQAQALAQGGTGYGAGFALQGNVGLHF